MKCFLLVLSLFSYGRVDSQDTLTFQEFNDSIDTNILSMHRIIDSSDSLSIGKAITLVKLHNTLTHSVRDVYNHREFKLNKNRFLQFDQCFRGFRGGIAQKVIEILQMETGNRNSQYSTEYDLYLGIPFNEKSYYYLVRKIK